MDPWLTSIMLAVIKEKFLYSFWSSVSYKKISQIFEGIAAEALGGIYYQVQQMCLCRSMGCYVDLSLAVCSDSGIYNKLCSQHFNFALHFLYKKCYGILVNRHSARKFSLLFFFFFGLSLVMRQGVYLQNRKYSKTFL